MEVLPDQPSRADVRAELRSRWYETPSYHRRLLVERYEDEIRRCLRDRNWQGFKFECERAGKLSGLPNTFYVLARLRLAIGDESATAGCSLDDPGLDILEMHLLRIHLLHQASDLEEAVRKVVRDAGTAFRTIVGELAGRGNASFATLNAQLALYRLHGRRDLGAAFSGLVQQRRVAVQKESSRDINRAWMSNMSRRRKNLEIESNRLEWSFDGKLNGLRDGLAEWKKALGTEARGATGTLATHLLDIGPVARQEDDRLVALWNGGVPTSDYRLHAARAAERQASVWVSKWRSGEVQIEDLSILQTLDPSDERWKLGDLQVTSPGWNRIYDVKNTVRSGRHAELTVARKLRARTENMSYIGVYTRGWVIEKYLPSLGAALASAAGKGNETALHSEFDKIELSVLGIFDAHRASEIKDFAVKHAPGVELRKIDLWCIQDPESGRAMLPPFVFTMPPEAWNPVGKISRSVLNQAMKIAEVMPSALLDLLGRGALRKDHYVGTWTHKEEWAARFKPLLTQALQKARTPRLYQVYLCVLQATLEELDFYFARRDEAALDRIQKLPELLDSIFFHGNSQRPLGAWDPTECVHYVALAFKALAKQASALKPLPRFDRLQVSAAGTVSAHRADDGIMVTLLCRCEKCSAWPLLYGHGKGYSSTTSPRLHARSCDICGRLICAEGHGCRIMPQPPECPSAEQTRRREAERSRR